MAPMQSFARVNWPKVSRAAQPPAVCSLALERAHSSRLAWPPSEHWRPSSSSNLLRRPSWRPRKALAETSLIRHKVTVSLSSTKLNRCGACARGEWWSFCCLLLPVGLCPMLELLASCEPLDKKATKRRGTILAPALRRPFNKLCAQHSPPPATCRSGFA